MTTIEHDIRDIIRAAKGNNDVPMPPKPTAKDFAPPAVREAGVTPPSYIDQDPDASKVARLSGAAVATEYEKAAVDIEQTAEHLKETIEKVMLHVRETAELYRKRGAELYKEIEDLASRADRVLKQSEDFRKQLKTGVFKNDDTKSEA